MEMTSLRQRLHEGKPLLGTWLTLGSTVGAQYLACQGFDWLGIDLEEYPVGGGQVASLIEAIQATSAMPLIRSRRGDTSAINSAMATGAAGVFIPRVRTAAQAAALLAPSGSPSAEDGLHIVMIETEHGLDHAEEILAVPGIDACFLVLGEIAQPRGSRVHQDAVSAELPGRLRSILAACHARGVVPGIHVPTAEQAAARIAEGWLMVAISTDGAFLTQAASDAVREIRRTAGPQRGQMAMQAQAYMAGCALAGAFEHGGY